LKHLDFYYSIFFFEGYKNIKTDNTQNLLKKKKLLLVLDIDHTFLHATKNPQAIQVTFLPQQRFNLYK
jgi:predicted secreted acid phosphatase